MDFYSNKYLDQQIFSSIGVHFLSLFSLLSVNVYFFCGVFFILSIDWDKRQASMNQALNIAATRLCSLFFDLYLFSRILNESSLNGCSHQVMFESFWYLPEFFMKQALMVLATKSCSNPFRFEGERDGNYHTLPSRLIRGIWSLVYQAPSQAIQAQLGWKSALVLSNNLSKCD